MTVKVILKQPAPNGMKEFIFEESAIIDDKKAGYVVLSYLSVRKEWIEQESYWGKNTSHIAYDWNDIERLEIRP